MATRNPPGYTHHKASGQARVHVDGQDIYLGKHGSPESRERYSHVIREWHRRQAEPVDHSTITMEHLSLAFLNHAKEYYIKNGEATGHLYMIRVGLKLLLQHYRGESVTEFTPRKLKRLQQVLIDRELSRTYINDVIGVIKRCCKWGGL